ncbi:MAG: ATP-binding cassette domain-containing protein [Bacteroidales bacterium]|nr:ATP-binding cassette domain-containing protein [Bacteroidales bacterium]
MNESILNAFLQLFAIIANVDKEEGLSFRGRNIVKSYLSQHLNSRLTNKYLRLFDHYIKLNTQNSSRDKASKTGTGQVINADKVSEICDEVKRGLVQREKFIVFLRLFEFINEDDVMTERELGFVRSVAKSFNIKDAVYKNTRAFIIDPLSKDVDKNNMLIIYSNNVVKPHGIKFIYREELDGQIVFLHHEPTNTFVFKYSGGGILYLNGEIIIPGRINILDQGALITGPKIKPVYYSDIIGRFFYREDASRIRFTAENIEFRYKKGSNGIKEFSFSKESGKLIGIMGGSGVGKSTLLNILSGKIKPYKGHVYINGFDIHKEKEKLTGLIGYVPQDDLLMEELSVFQNLYFNAKLCFSDLSENEIIRKVSKTLADLELDDIKDLKVGNPLNKFISGGQRKRLNFALELIREPAILFIDEPTSGLSSMDSEKVMHLLKEQTLKDKLIFVNIHQPFSDIFKLFDRILILDMGGYPIYKGNPIDGLKYFKSLSHYVNADEGQCISCGNVNPEEILRIVEAKEIDEFGRLTKERKVSPKEWHNNYKKEIESKTIIHIGKEELPKVISRIPGPLVQFRIFISRNVLSKLADHQYMLINFLEAPLLALIIGFFTKFVRDSSPTGSFIFQENENLPAYLFMAVVVALFMGLMVSAEEIISDRKILERESFLNLSHLSYLNSKVILVFTISAIQTFTFVLVANAVLGIKGLDFSYWIILFSTSCVANMIGLNLSAGLNSVITIYILIPFVLIPQLLLSGVVVDFDRLNKVFRHSVYVPLIGDVMPSRWSYEALAVNQFKNNKYEKMFFAVEKKQRMHLTSYHI